MIHQQTNPAIMNETPPVNPPASSEVELARERSKQVNNATTLGGVTVIAVAILLINQPTWPVVGGVAALCAMAAATAGMILKRP